MKPTVKFAMDELGVGVLPLTLIGSPCRSTQHLLPQRVLRVEGLISAA